MTTSIEKEKGIKGKIRDIVEKSKSKEETIIRVYEYVVGLRSGDGFVKKKKRDISEVEFILGVVNATYKFSKPKSLKDIKAENKCDEIVEVRQFVQYALHRGLGYSLKRAGEVTGKTLTTVRHSCGIVEGKNLSDMNKTRKASLDISIKAYCDGKEVEYKL